MTQELLNWAIGAGFAVFGWFARELWSAVKDLKVDLSRLREEIPTKYATRTDMEYMFGKIDTKLDRIVDKIDSKADK